ncbi:hypothetical protein M0R72_00725 [Candidatus Pacearchaeota archaeon]|jgi:hypothetical protein|nr:hypothetical protein [Candidatus Pacearchaeota archaeon]
MDKPSVVRIIRIARAEARSAFKLSKHHDGALAANSSNDAYTAAEKLVLDGSLGWKSEALKQLQHTAKLEYLVLGSNSNAAKAIAALEGLE